MPSALSHAAPALALAVAFHRRGAPRRLWLAGVACAIAPDLDVVSFSLGVPYEAALGHRGLWHSIPFAAGAAAVVALALSSGAARGVSRARAWSYLFLATASHGVLDAFTNGGLGVALWSPFDLERYFFPFRPIEVSPLGTGAFLSERGARILANELIWVWLPCALVAATCVALRRGMTWRSTK